MRTRAAGSSYAWLASIFLVSVSNAQDESPRATVSPQFDARVYGRLAVYVEDRTQRRLAEGVIRAIDDEFTRVAIERGYTLATRSDTETVLREVSIQASDYTEAALAQSARALNVNAIIVVSINGLDIEPFMSARDFFLGDGRKRSYRATGSLSARMISADLAQVVWLSSHQVAGRVGGDRRTDYAAAAGVVLPEVAAAVANTLPVRIL